MRSKTVALLIAFAAPWAAALAADFWVSKPYAEWNDKEVMKLLSSSPWAKPITITTRSRKDVAAGVSADQRFGSENDVGTQKLTLTLVWNGKTVRMAQVRQRQLKGQAADADKDKAFIDGLDKDSYVFVLNGTPNAMVHGQAFQPLVDATPDQLKAATRLMLGDNKDAKAVAPDRVEKPADSVAVFYFPREGNPITAEMKEVIFSSKIGDVDVNHGFDLEDMSAGGGLDL